MGVGIAYKVNKFDLLDVDITTISDTKKIAKIKKDSRLNIISAFVKNFRKFFQHGRVKEKEDIWKTILTRKNQMVCIRLRSKGDGKSFVIGTYHMPCLFRLPAAMIAHCALSAQHIQRIAANHDDPYIFAGDFNITPDSQMYKLMTENSVVLAAGFHGENLFHEEKWSPRLDSMKSAYKEFYGKEPAFTNYAKVKGNKEAFVDTLDYIFYSRHWKVLDAGELPLKDIPERGPFPNRLECSDHIALTTTITIEK